MKLKRKSLTLILVLALAIPVSMRVNVEKAHAIIDTLSLTSPANNAHSMDTTPDFIFLPVSNVSTTINCTLYLADAASGDVQATNNTETTITCNQTLTVSGDPYEWYINATDTDETAKSEVRNIYIVPSTGPIDIPDDYDLEEDPRSSTGPKIGLTQIAGTIAFCAVIIVLGVMTGGGKALAHSARRHFKRRG